MYILITGLPGTGKTTIANNLKVYKKRFKVFSDKDYCLSQKLGQTNKQNELVVSIQELSKSLLSFIKENPYKNIIFEGHLWCELPKSILKKMDFVFVVVTSKTCLQKRLKERKYNDLKVIENLFCKETNYIENLLDSKNIFYYKINVNNNLKSNLNKINKHLNC
jgi:broad-specificity NMP kinase